MHRGLLMLLVVVGTPICAGCVGAPMKPHYTEDILVANTDWWKYWSFNKKYMAMVGSPVPGCILYEAIIDSDGYPFDGKPVAYVGAPALIDAAKKMVALQHFMPTDANPNRTPVKAIFELSFLPDPTDPYHRVWHPRDGYAPSPGYEAVIKQCTDQLYKQLPSAPAVVPAAAQAATL